MAGLSFLKDFKKTLTKMDTIVTDFGPPKFWYSTGNLAVNKTISGSFKKGIPQGRITCLAGPSGAGKSYILSNIVKNAQAQGAFILMLDSEHAMDIGYLKKIGVDVSDEKFLYAGVTTFSDVVKVVSEFITDYEKAYGRDNPESPPVVIALDSIDMLITDSETEHFDKGVQKGDQGQRAKQSKHMLRTLVSRIKRNPMGFLVTHQVYPNADLLNGQGLWIVNNAIRYSASQILLITPLKLREGTEVIGVRMRVETYKSRFAQVGTKTEIEVPYSTGMNPYSGFLEMMEDLGIVKSAGAWKSFEAPGKEVRKFQTKHLDEALVNEMLAHPIIVQSEKDILELMADEANFTAEAEGLVDIAKEK
jgi:recombination protein RecA